MDVCVIQVPYDSGRLGERMGLGPERIFEAALAPLLHRRGLRFDSIVIELNDSFTAEIATAFELCRKVSRAVLQCRQQGKFPIVLSGNCSIAVGTVNGCGAAETDAVWFDAHGETTTPETTTSGFLDGMGISILTGQCWQTLARSIPGYVPKTGEGIILFGARDLEPAEHDLLSRLGVARLDSAQQLDAHLAASAGFRQVYVHLDLDVLDPAVARGNQWAPPGGIDREGLLQAMFAIRKHTSIAAFGVASYNPAVDHDLKALDVIVRAVEVVLGQDA